MKSQVFRTSVFASPACLFGMAAISASYLHAPLVSAQANRVLEVVEVTARRRVENQQDVPISMTVMSGDILRENNITKIEDLGVKVPSLRISGAGGSLNEPLVSLRGQRPSESAFNQDQAVPIYFNDVVITPTQGSNLAMYDLQNVQVLKGPQGTLFGRNSTGGAILMTPQRPGEELGGYMEVKVGNYDLFGLEGAIDVPVTDNLRTRLSVRKLDRDGYQENVANNELRGDTYGDEHSKGARLSIEYSNDGFSNQLLVAQDENDIAASVPVMTGAIAGVGLGSILVSNSSFQRNVDRNDPWKIETNVDSEEYVKNVFSSNITEFELSDGLTIKNIIGYRKVDFETATDIDGIDYPGWGTLQATAIVTDPRPTLFESEFYSEELQLLGTALDDRLDWIVGAYFSKTDMTQDYLVQQSPDFGGGPRVDTGVTDAINKSKGVFTEGTYRFNTAWSVTAGVRQSWDDREITVTKYLGSYPNPSCNIYSGGVLDPDCERTEDETFSSPTWRLSANYTPQEDMLLYASVSTGYRAGGFNTRGSNDATLQPFDEETVTTYEIGHKADWNFDWGMVRTNTAIYMQDYEDIHHTRSFLDGAGTLVTRTENAAKAEITGLEFDLTVAPSENLMLNLSYAYVDAEYKEKTDLIGAVAGLFNGAEVDTTSNDFPFIPKQSLTLSATYTLPLSADLGEMSMTASLYWQDDMTGHALINNFSDFTYVTARNGVGQPTAYAYWTPEMVEEAQAFSQIDDYQVLNLRYDWRSVMGSNFDVAAYIDNVEDETYPLGGLNVLGSGGYGAYLYGPPRTVGASLRYNF